MLRQHPLGGAERHPVEIERFLDELAYGFVLAYAKSPEANQYVDALAVRKGNECPARALRLNMDL